MKSSEHAPPAPTLVDVARQAGVNKVTASVVLSGGQGNTRVSEQTRQRILLAAEALHYQPNALARSLRSRRTHTVGFYMSEFVDLRDLFMTEIISGLHQGCQENKHDFLMHGTFRGRSTDEVYAHLLNGKVDGLVLHVDSNDPLLPRLADSRLRVVAVANPVPSLPSVTVDDAAGSRLLAQHLAGKGYTRIVYAACPHALSSVVRREKAFLDAASALGLTVAVRPTDAEGGVPDGFLSLPGGGRARALVCWNDLVAYRLITHFRLQGLRVPEDLAVAGFDGMTSEIPPAYRLTTLRAPWHEVARAAVSLLCLSPGKPPLEETVLPVHLVAGETT